MRRLEQASDPLEQFARPTRAAQALARATEHVQGSAELLTMGLIFRLSVSADWILESLGILKFTYPMIPE